MMNKLIKYTLSYLLMTAPTYLVADHGDAQENDTDDNTIRYDMNQE